MWRDDITKLRREKSHCDGSITAETRDAPASDYCSFRSLEEGKKGKPTSRLYGNLRSFRSTSSKLVTLVMSLFLIWMLLFSFRNHLINKPLHLSLSSCPAVYPSPKTLDGLVYICTGKGCNLNFLCKSVNLLRFESNWQGPIYIISDRPAFLEGEACNRNQPNYTTIAAPETPTLMHMKNFKRQLFTLIDRDATRLIYIDADILPVGCIANFLEHESPRDIGMFRDSWCRGCNTFLGGFVFMTKTPATEACLEAWTNESSSNNFTKYHKDQDAFDQLLGKGPCAGLVHTLSYSFIETFDDFMILPFYSKLIGKQPTFQHFSHGIRAQPIWSRINGNIEKQIAALNPLV